MTARAATFASTLVLSHAFLPSATPHTTTTITLALSNQSTTDTQKKNHEQKAKLRNLLAKTKLKRQHLAAQKNSFHLAKSSTHRFVSFFFCAIFSFVKHYPHQCSKSTATTSLAQTQSSTKILSVSLNNNDDSNGHNF